MEHRSRRTDMGTQSTFDYSLLLITLCLVGFGLLMIYSASSYTAQIKYGESTFFLRKQAVGVLAGVVAMYVVARFPYKMFLKPMPLIRIRFITFLYWVAVALQTLVLFVGAEVNGAKRWLYIGPLSIQPSEITKIVIILVAAYFIQMHPQDIDRVRGLVRVFLPTGILILLVARQNLSTAIVTFLIVYGMCFIAARRKRLYILAIIAGAVLAILYIKFGASFRLERFEIWNNVETHPKGYQILQGLYAIASGGIFGSGLGESMQKLGFIPESHNDMIFSIICEELGLVGAGIVVLMFVLLLWRVLNTAMYAPDLFTSLICTGVMIHIASQVFINISVVTNFLPSTGIPLPFISYGGTSVMILMAEMGLVLGISARCRPAP